RVVRLGRGKTHNTTGRRVKLSVRSFGSAFACHLGRRPRCVRCGRNRRTRCNLSGTGWLLERKDPCPMKSIFLHYPRACRLAIVVLASALAPAVRAQESTPLPDDSPAERRAVIRTIADHLEASYVIADVANEMATSL